MAYSNVGFFPGYSSSDQNDFSQENFRSPPTDPSSCYYQVICYVCKELSKPDEPHSHHYGGVVCLSCRAFFRRAHQKTRSPHFICKRGDLCEVTVATRRRCQRCRYVRCIAAGMNPNAVLSDDEKVVRFRKTIMKKLLSRESTMNNSLEKWPESVQFEDNENEILDLPEAGDFETLERIIETRDLQLSPTINKEVNDSAFVFPTMVDTNFLEKVASKKMANLLKSIFQNYHFIANADQLIHSFLNKISTNKCVGLEELRLLRKEITEAFTNFAKSQRNFSKLCQSDQRTLLARNNHLFAPFCFACCVLSENGEVQGLGQHFKEKAFLESNQSRKIRSISKIFRSDTDLNRLDQLVRFFYPIIEADSIKVKAVLVYLLIFVRDTTTIIVDEIIMKDVELESSSLAATVLVDKEFLSQGIHILEEISEILNQSNAWKGFESWNKYVGSQSVAIKFTNEEELWLNSQLVKLQEAHWSVPFGEETTNEFMMYSLEVPVSKKFMKAVFSITLERIKRILESQPEFVDLPIENQFKMLSINSRVGLALRVARYESSKNGTVQITESLGGSEKETWNENYQPILNSKNKVKKITMEDVAKQNSVNLTKEQLDHFIWLNEEMSTIAADDELYRILKLMSLLKTDGIQTSPAIQNLSNIFALSVKRRIEDIFRNQGITRTGSQSNITKIFSSPQECHQKMSECLLHAESLADILIYIMNTSS